MTWGTYLTDWQDRIDTLLALFPHTDRAALVRFRGNLDHLAGYIADTHELTLAEAHELIDTRLLPAADARRLSGPSLAA